MKKKAEQRVAWCLEGTRLFKGLQQEWDLYLVCSVLASEASDESHKRDDEKVSACCLVWLQD